MTTQIMPMPIIMPQHHGDVEPNAVLAIYLAFNLFLIIALIINFFVVRNSLDFKGKSLINKMFFSSWVGLNVPTLALIMINAFAIVFATAIFILNNFL